MFEMKKDLGYFGTYVSGECPKSFSWVEIMKIYLFYN